MKKTFVQLLSKANLLTLALAALACTTVTSCIADDDEEEEITIEDAKYVAEAAKFEITDANSPYESIELTEGGTYIIKEDTTASAVKTKATVQASKGFTRMFVPQAGRVTRGSVSGILYGTYTKTGDGEYYLEGYGTLKVVTENGSAVSLEVTPIGGTTQTIQGNRTSSVADSETTRYLCRTWKFDKYTYYVKYNGKTMVSISGRTLSELVENMKTWIQKHASDEDEVDVSDIVWNPNYEPEKVVFTRSGTYMVYYSDSSVAVVGWHWVSENDKKLQYDWGFDYTDADTGVAWVSFSGSKMLLTEMNSGTFDDDEYGESTAEVGLTYTMSEVK